MDGNSLFILSVHFHSSFSLFLFFPNIHHKTFIHVCLKQLKHIIFDSFNPWNSLLTSSLGHQGRCLILSTLQISLFLVSLFLTKGQVLETYSSEDGVIFFGDLNQRNILNTGEFPDTKFFTSFSEMAKRVWLLHCLAFSFEPQAFIFQVEKACRFSDVYMECMNDEISVEESERQVAFTVVPGFRIGRTIIQCQVYLSAPNQGKKFTAKTKVATRRHYS